MLVSVVCQDTAPLLVSLSYQTLFCNTFGVKSTSQWLTTLETRRLRGHQIEVFKILNGYENIGRNMCFSVKEKRTRGHGVS